MVIMAICWNMAFCCCPKCWMAAFIAATFPFAAVVAWLVWCVSASRLASKVATVSSSVSSSARMEKPAPAVVDPVSSSLMLYASWMNAFRLTYVLSATGLRIHSRNSME